jgi:hypothetical protein
VSGLPEELQDLVDSPPGDLICESGRNARHAAICRIVNYLIAHELDTDWLVDSPLSDGAADGRRRTARSVARATDTFDPALWGATREFDREVHERLLRLVVGSDARAKVMRTIIEEGIEHKTLTPAVSSHCPRGFDGLSQRHANNVLRDFEVTLAGGLLTGHTPAPSARQARRWHLNPEWDGTMPSRKRACLKHARLRERCDCTGVSSHISPRKRYENKSRSGDEARQWILEQPPETRFTTGLLYDKLGISRQSAGRYLRQVIGEGQVYKGRRPLRDKLGELKRNERYWFNN